MKRLYVIANDHLLHLDNFSDISVQQEILNIQTGHFTERMEATNAWVVQADRVVLYKSNIKEKCQEYLRRLSYAICRSEPHSNIIATPESVFAFIVNDEFRFIPEEKYQEDLCTVVNAPNLYPLDTPNEQLSANP